MDDFAGCIVGLIVVVLLIAIVVALVTWVVVMIGLGLAYLGMCIVIGLDYLAHGWIYLGVHNPAMGWLLLGALAGGSIGVIVGLGRAGRKKPSMAVIGTVAAAALLLIMGAYTSAPRNPAASSISGQTMQPQAPPSVLFEGSVGGDVVNVRDSPPGKAMLGKSIAKLTRGSRVRVIGEEGDWYRVRWGESFTQEGWISARYVARPGAEPRPQKVAEVAPSPSRTTSANDKLLEPASLTQVSPEVYRVRLETTSGSIVVQVTRAWAPYAADRFYNLVKNRYYDGVRFFRVIPGFVVQFGLSGDPGLNKAWEQARLQDDPVVKSNARGCVSFAAAAAPNTRTTQIFINLKNNEHLDGKGFSPFGEVIEGMEVVDRLFAAYGERPQQSRILSEGNEYLIREFPRMDYVRLAVLEAPPELGEESSDHRSHAPGGANLSQPREETAGENPPPTESAGAEELRKTISLAHR